MPLAPLLLAAGLRLGAGSATAVFAGGSFWCLEPVFESLPGVDSAEAGYAGGTGPAPVFDQVVSGATGWIEAVRVTYRPDRIPYAKLLEAYWRHVDPTRADGQFTDEGPEYRPVLFTASEGEMRAAEASRSRLARSGRFAKPIVVRILPAGEFYRAEPEHQDYARKNGARYRAYYRFSGREAFFAKAWGASAPPAGEAGHVRPGGPRAGPGAR